LRGVPAVIFGGGRDIELYTDRMSVDIVAKTPALALRAVAQLEPFNRAITASWPAFPIPQFKPGVPPAQVAQSAGATGDSGPTLSPPATLQPNPSGK
jgi:hypothetical protein